MEEADQMPAIFVGSLVFWSKVSWGQAFQFLLKDEVYCKQVCGDQAQNDF